MHNRRQLVTRASEDMRAPGGIMFWGIICIVFYSSIWMYIQA